jgi:hypothetical protein
MYNLGNKITKKSHKCRYNKNIFQRTKVNEIGKERRHTQTKASQNNMNKLPLDRGDA